MDKGYSTRESAFVVQDPKAPTLLKEGNVRVEVEVESLLMKDSLELTDADRDLVRRKVEEEPAVQILITHGTDTMARTGKHLREIPGKTIVLTGSMQPAEFKHSDAAFNLGFALACVQTLPAGVYLAMNGRVFDPDRVSKNLEEDRFEEASAEKERA